MHPLNPNVLLAIPLLPLAAALIAGLGGRWIGRTGAHTVTCLAVGISCLLSLLVLQQVYSGHAPLYDQRVYAWLVSDGMSMQVGFWVDRLTALMMAVVTFVSLCVHVYTIGYMADDPGYTRFFSYISLFTFSMLMLVMANNFMQLFFGWEAVGVVSYLLIGFWYTRPSATFAALKAFIVNRIGDFGFVLGIAGIAYYTGSLDYRSAFAAAPGIAQAVLPITSDSGVPALTLICICLFIGAMGKSAQVPLHVWLPDSMEGPTPISALIHAATMVTAGIFMVARMSPLFEYSDAALSFVMVIGAITAFFMGLLGVVNNDIKRVIAYSTLSQLGYMTVALGASAYGAAIFHLMTHAFFKALLFLAAGSVIIALHHEQDMRRMGGLGKYMPITAVTCWIGALALVGTPFFSGYYSKDAIIEAVGASHRFGSGFAYWCVLLGVFVTSLYTFRLLFMTFHGPERFRDPATPAASPALSHEGGKQAPAHAPGEPGADVRAASAHGTHGDEHHGDPHESPAVVTVPLIALAIPSVLIGAFTVAPVLFGDYFGRSIFVLAANDVVARVAEEFAEPVWVSFGLHGLIAPPFWLAVLGAVTAWLFFLRNPAWAQSTAQRFAWLYRLLTHKYYFDWVNEKIIAPLTRGIGIGLWRGGDEVIIDGAMVNGTAAGVSRFGSILRQVQTGYLYSYAFWMMIGLALLLGWFLLHFRG
ncbi:MAG: NADH-quinone oxidoreductase subunit L [Gammaproteobacteria bacterium]|nr:NADH-quinone oxidoreductase subunit L [Gammaproteobacteria bacterium]MBV9725799.1 NADH-quinone oxidoreductase subunit L [Gammaproteobacteria bacterium]